MNEQIIKVATFTVPPDGNIPVWLMDGPSILHAQIDKERKIVSGWLTGLPDMEMDESGVRTFRKRFVYGYWIIYIHNISPAEHPSPEYIESLPDANAA
jgi:hypothetical protein